MSPAGPETIQPRTPIGLAAYGFGYLCGFAGTGTPRACPSPYTVHDLMDLAAARGYVRATSSTARICWRRTTRRRLVRIDVRYLYSDRGL